MQMNIPITKPFFDEREFELIKKPLESGWLVQGEFVRKFEDMFSNFVKIDYAKALSSCTTALHISLEALGIGRDDKVVVPSFTYIASANAVEYAGAEPVFCDIDLRTFNIDINQLGKILEEDKKNGKKIKAIMPVNLFGLCADLPAVVEIAKEYDVFVIEDSACGLGAYIGDKHSGTFGDFGCFSFHPRKVITTGEGGMAVCRRKELAEKVDVLRNHGASKSDLQRHKSISGSLLPEFDIKGFNYRMTDLQGAIGVAQMEKLELILEKRKAVANRYYLELEQIKELIPPFIPEGYIHGFQSYVCLYSGGIGVEDITLENVEDLNIKRNEFMYKLEEKGISVRQGTHAVHTTGYYKNKYGLKEDDFPNSFLADRLTVALPLFAGMDDGEFEYVIENIKKAI